MLIGKRGDPLLEIVVRGLRIFPVRSGSERANGAIVVARLRTVCGDTVRFIRLLIVVSGISFVIFRF